MKNAEGDLEPEKKPGSVRVSIKRSILIVFVTFSLVFGVTFYLKDKVNRSNSENSFSLWSAMQKRDYDYDSDPILEIKETDASKTSQQLIQEAETLHKKKNQTVILSMKTPLDLMSEADEYSTIVLFQVISSTKDTKIQISREYENVPTEYIAFSKDYVTANELNLITGQLIMSVSYPENSSALYLLEWAKGFTNSFIEENNNKDIKSVTLKLTISGTTRNYLYDSRQSNILVEVKKY